MAFARSRIGGERSASLSALGTNFRQQRVLVLGAGFMGAHIVQALTNAGHQVEVVTRSPPRSELRSCLAGAKVVLADLAGAWPAAELLARTDHVIYAVGSSSPAESDLDPGRDIALIVPSVLRLLEMMRLRPTLSLTYLSSGGAVYGDVAGLATEDTRALPISSYGIIKRTVEHYLRMYQHLYDLPIRVLRVANVYGPGQGAYGGQGLVAHLLHSMTMQRPFQVFGRGEHVRDYVYIEDAAIAIANLIDSPAPYQTYNVGSGVGHSIMEVIEMLEGVARKRIGVEFRDPRPFDVFSIVLDISRLQSCIDYTPRDLASGLLSTWHAYCAGQQHADTADLVQVSGAAE